jgi:anaerobic selenocysteine-containing dehydrogenase
LLFKNVKGEENRRVTGLKELWALRDPKLAADMSKAIDEIRYKKTPEEKKAAVEEFKKKFAAHLHLLIDPAHPDFGPKNNQVSFVWGRVKAGRAEFIKRFISESFGSTNAHGHTTVCQGSLYFTGKAMSDQFVEGKLTGGQKFYWQADTSNVDFLLAIGSAYIEGGYGPTHHARKLMQRLIEGKVKIAVVDPRFSKIAAKAYKWVPAKPGSEAALALGMIRWIIEQKRFDEKFLSAANKAAAKAAGEQSWTNAAWLVKEDGAFLHASEIGLAQKEKRQTKEGKEWEFDPFVILSKGQPVAFDPNDEKNAAVGDVLVNTTVNGVKVKSSLQIIYESVAAKTIEEWADICGISPDDIVELAREFTAHGKRAVADYWLNAVQPTNEILLNSQDASRLGLSEGDQVKIVSKSNPDGVWDLKNGTLKPMVGEVKVIEGIRPGVIAFSLGKGHWAYGSSDVRIDGKIVKGDSRRATGIHANAAMRLDEYMKNTCLIDPVGGSVSFFDTRVRLMKV